MGAPVMLCCTLSECPVGAPRTLSHTDAESTPNLHQKTLPNSRFRHRADGCPSDAMLHSKRVPCGYHPWSRTTVIHDTRSAPKNIAKLPCSQCQACPLPHCLRHYCLVPSARHSDHWLDGQLMPSRVSLKHDRLLAYTTHSGRSVRTSTGLVLLQRLCRP